MASIFAGENDGSIISTSQIKSTTFRSYKRSLSSSSSDSSSGVHAAKSCVCAPPTHAGSFKCRLHRVNSDSQSSPPPAPQPPVSASSTRTVEAQ